MILFTIHKHIKKSLKNGNIYLIKVHLLNEFMLSIILKSSVMKLKLLTTFILIFIFLSHSFSQTQLKHEKKIYVSPQGKVYVNKTLPIYIKIASSPQANAPTYNLPSVTTSKYANPMYFDTEGRNTLRSPWAVDTVTKQTVNPKIEIQLKYMQMANLLSLN